MVWFFVALGGNFVRFWKFKRALNSFSERRGMGCKPCGVPKPYGSSIFWSSTHPRSFTLHYNISPVLSCTYSGLCIILCCRFAHNDLILCLKFLVWRTELCSSSVANVKRQCDSLRAAGYAALELPSLRQTRDRIIPFWPHMAKWAQTSEKILSQIGIKPTNTRFWQRYSSVRAKMADEISGLFAKCDRGVYR